LVKFQPIYSKLFQGLEKIIAINWLYNITVYAKGIALFYVGVFIGRSEYDIGDRF
jgi:hypothetical protein